MKKQFLFIIISALLFAGCSQKDASRTVLNLKGEWQIAKTTAADKLPSEYHSVVPVPGLVDLAVPSVETVVMPNEDTRQSQGYKDGWFWHKRTFNVSNINYDVIQLKIFKARYHTKVFINGQFAGENYFCFTPSYFELKPFLKKGENEIVIGVGNKFELPEEYPNGNDYEKITYIPGIYDNVEITFSNKPYITNIQCAPDIVNKKLLVEAEIESDNTFSGKLMWSIREKNSGKVVKKGINLKDATNQTVTKSSFTIDFPDATLWTPETPFLYELTLNTGKDVKTVTFGMRTFRFDAEKRIALLNEKPYYLRGTNVCIYRFFEDPDRASLPWDEAWTVKLHERFKSMNWEMARYCIGFPPEKWYDVCDSLGFMIQDEFPVWGIYNFKTETLAEEYRRWMRERWNHPSVVIWDAQNETVTTVTGEAIQQVRNLDLSHRPWENGWSDPVSPTDVVESHPYLFNDYMVRPKEPEEGYRKQFFSIIRRPDNDVTAWSPTTRGTDSIFLNPVLINEYGWIWLNRDGSTTTLTDKVYETLWNGSKLSPQQRLHLYARHLAIATEYWRAHRRAAGILHFCGLAYSRPKTPRGQTSDHFIDIRNLTFEPEFEKYVKPSFAPVGLMVDLWEKSYKPTAKITVPIYIINDLPKVFEQEIVLTLEQPDGKTISSTILKARTNGYEINTITTELTLPQERGDYLLRAETIVNNEKVFSIRDITIK